MALEKVPFAPGGDSLLVVVIIIKGDVLLARFAAVILLFTFDPTAPPELLRSDFYKITL
jgi:hypothetical protein